MELEDYIKTHPEQFKDDIDKWLFLEFGIIGGCCYAEKSHEYHIARMVAEKFNDVFIKKVYEWLKENAADYVVHHWNETMLDTMSLIEDFRNYMKGE